MNTIITLSEKINNAKALDFGTIFSASIDLFKKTWLQGFLLQLFTVIIMAPLIIILYVPLITMLIANAGSDFNETETFSAFFAGFSLLYILFICVGVFVLGAVSVALNAAFFRILKKLDHDEQVSTSDFFYFLKGKYLRKTAVLVIASILISIPAALLCFIPLIYVMVPMSFFAIIFAFNPELSVGDIVRASFKLGHKKWLLTFGLMIVASLLSQIVGVLLCGIGALFTAAFVYHPTYLIYKEVIGFENDNEVETI